MIIVEVEQPILPKCKGEVSKVALLSVPSSSSFILLYVSLANHTPSTMYLSTSPLQGTFRKHW